MGASPGASTSVQAMLIVLERCFSDRLKVDWQKQVKLLVPSYGESLIDNATLLKKIRGHTRKILKLE